MQIHNSETARYGIGLKPDEINIRDKRRDTLKSRPRNNLRHKTSARSNNKNNPLCHYKQASPSRFSERRARAHLDGLTCTHFKTIFLGAANLKTSGETKTRDGPHHLRTSD
ncbi:hypothetical protein EVAR_7998_1 [Eumeta japonica]|uniref:Uncharacterized protein n=1 Tax=Eumeta variegata TaxID=151549 RepID=A0A4C1TJK3_EUMVA|nr:hypothetical protein EVAR_7998_1 [Eumeta japonica]